MGAKEYEQFYKRTEKINLMQSLRTEIRTGNIDYEELSPAKREEMKRKVWAFSRIL